ncbi:MAG: hypothetical protein KQJ78_02085 [Deltaproteobacteria bacterium]|nr:hypothetical protein [Deltaproteobacteria bacterium]
MKKFLGMLLLALVLATALPALAETALLRPQGGGNNNCWCPPPRFQIYQAPRPYGGMLMVDTQTGATYQRVIVNSKGGISIRWLKLPLVEQIPPTETILWE